jgi:hypothetical protein
MEMVGGKGWRWFEGKFRVGRRERLETVEGKGQGWSEREVGDG